MQNQPRRFPPPWDIEDNGGCSIVRDNNGAGARLMCILGDEPGRRATSKPLTRDEARRSRRHLLAILNRVMLQRARSMRTAMCTVPQR